MEDMDVNQNEGNVDQISNLSYEDIDADFEIGFSKHSHRKMLNIRFLNFCLGNNDSKNTVLHGCLHLIHLGVLREPEPSHELATHLQHQPYPN
ncbi:hypothetical protein Ahy_B01g056600 [Arachis hypogaea]|uniref:Uncharacterized protein n=1 Tax=Arachis hypogaea TaxID=3818 RepID=A0A445AZ62_ARAHY|nr:hypothetical protein Ahy_B01g056600 [Arachis hypogaea]